MTIPAGRTLLVNRLVRDDGRLYNESAMLPSGGFQRKRFPDETETAAGICAGGDFPLFTLADRKFKVIICTDLRHIDTLPTAGADFVLHIFHFTPHNRDDAEKRLRALSRERGLPVAAASLCSDRNCGHSLCVSGNTVVSLGDRPGILEIEL